MKQDAILPTPEQIAKMGENYQPPKISQKVNRPYATRKSALDALRAKSYHMSADHYAVLSDLRMWMLGAEKHLGLVSSYGQQRWDGTPTSQMDLTKMMQVPWAIRCGENVREAEEVVGHQRQWAAIMLVLKNDLNFRDVGAAMGVTGRAAGEIFWKGAEKLLNHYRPRQRSDYLQTHPNPGIDNR